MKKVNKIALSAFAVTGVVLMAPPLVEASTANTTVSSAVGATISAMTSSGTVNVNTNPTGAGVQTIASDTVTVSTNDAAGYTLKLADGDTANTLVSGGNTIPSVSGTQAAPVVETANTWGYRVDGAGGFGAGPTSGGSNGAISGTIKFAPVPLSSGTADTLKTTAVTATNDTTTVWYGVATNTSQPSGTYTDSVTYTATAN